MPMDRRHLGGISSAGIMAGLYLPRQNRRVGHYFSLYEPNCSALFKRRWRFFLLLSFFFVSLLACGRV